jgi:HEAT repeat protein
MKKNVAVAIVSLVLASSGCSRPGPTNPQPLETAIGILGYSYAEGGIAEQEESRRQAMAAVRAAGADAPTRLIKALSDGHWYVRGGAAEALRWLPSSDAQAAVPGLITALGDDAVVVREQASHTLAEIVLGNATKDKPATVPPDLRKLLRNGKAAGRTAAAGVILHISPGDAPAITELRTHLRAENSQEIDDAVGALKPLGAKALPALDDLIIAARGRPNLSGPNRQAIAVIGSIGPAAKAAVPALMELLGDYKAAHDAADALARIGAIDALIAVVAEPISSEVKPEAVTAPTALPAFAPPPKPSDVRRMAATWALGAIGRNAAAAVPALRQEVASPDPLLANAAREALSKIEK